MPLTENSSNCAPLTARGKAASNTKLSADWQLSAALLSRPVDLRALVTLSGKNPSSVVLPRAPPQAGGSFQPA